MNRKISHLLKNKATLLIYIFIGFSFIFLIFLSKDASAQMMGPSPRRQILYGTVQLNYERLWREDKPTSTEFGQNYTLGYRGFLIDPRLINFNTSATLTRTESNTGSDSTLKGINLNVNLLEVPPRRWTGVRKYIPSPIMLRYSNYSNDYDSTNYGLSLIYSELFRSIGEKKEGKNKTAFRLPPPTIYFDYDKNDYESERYKNITNLYSLRALLNGKTYNYAFHYEHLDQKGTTAFDRSTITLRSHHSFFKKETKRRTDFDNLLKMQQIDDKDQLFFSSNLRWHKPVNEDVLSFLGGLDYALSSGGEKKSESYIGSVSGSYTKTFSPKTINTTSMSLTYGEMEDSTPHSERLSNNITVDLSRVFKSSGGVFLGNTDKGSEYGINTLLSTKTKISASAGYSFNSLSHEDGEKVTHTFTLSTSGPLRYNVNLNTNASYTMRDVSDIIGPYSENVFYYFANLFWRLPKTTLSFSGNYSQTTKHDGEKVETRIISLNNYLSRIITRRTFLNIYTTWTKELDNDSGFFEVRPILQWRARAISFDVEYNYRKTTSNITAQAEHRIFMRVVRRFFKLL
ncbi:MAG: hypothetical protein Q8N09_08225 [Thermodesulfovibrionia bacterium]|nr:hypothetical protein [Thermodesulfovibrionia bacterium]